MMRRPVTILTALLVLFCVNMFAQVEMTNEAKKLFKAAETARKTGDYTGAIAKFDEALKLSPHPQIYFRRGVALMKAHKLDDAIESYKKAIEMDSNYFQSYFMMAQVYYSKKEYQKAIDYFEKTAEVSKSKTIKKKVAKNIKNCKEKIAYPFVVEANTLLLNNKFDAAIAKFNEALAVYERSDAYSGLANAYLEKGNPDKALEFAKKSLKAKSRKNVAANFFMGLAYKAKGDKTNAKKYLSKCLRDKNFKQRAAFEIKEMK